MKRRLGIVVMVIGAGMAAFGVEELFFGAARPSEPIDVELLAIEAGAPLPSEYIRLGRHWRLYDSSLHTTLSDRVGSRRSGRVKSVLYPVISSQSPSGRALMRLSMDGGRVLNYRKGQTKIPQPRIRVVVKSTAFKTVDDIPSGAVSRRDLEGLVLTEAAMLEPEERNLLRARFPLMDLDDLVILEAGRKPNTRIAAMFITGSGMALLVMPLVLFFLPSGPKPSRKQVISIPADSPLHRPYASAPPSRPPLCSYMPSRYDKKYSSGGLDID